MRRNAELAQDYAFRHNVPKWYDQAPALINDPEVDAIYVATPPAFHQEYTLLAAKSGKPVYVEKPMARNYPECQAMIQACHATEVPLFVAYYRRSLPRFTKIKELLDSKAIGEIRAVTSTLSITRQEDLNPVLSWQVDPKISGGGWFMDMVCHNLDLLDFFLGPIRKVDGTATNQAGRYQVEDMVSGGFIFESGVHGVGAWSFAGYKNLDRTEIIGSQGKITFSTFGAEPILLTTETETVEFVIDNPLHVQQPLVQTVVNALNGVGSCPSTGESAARTAWVMDEFLKGFREKNG